MNNSQRPRGRSTGLGGDAESRALDRYENEGGPGPDDIRDRRRDAQTGDCDVADPGAIVVTPGFTADAVQIHHREIPDLHADGATPGAAAANLAQDLQREIAGVADDFRRGLFERILADVHAFAALQAPAEAPLVRGAKERSVSQDRVTKKAGTDLEPSSSPAPRPQWEDRVIKGP